MSEDISLDDLETIAKGEEVNPTLPERSPETMPSVESVMKLIEDIGNALNDFSKANPDKHLGFIMETALQVLLEFPYQWSKESNLTKTQFIEMMDQEVKVFLNRAQFRELVKDGVLVYNEETRQFDLANKLQSEEAEVEGSSSES